MKFSAFVRKHQKDPIYVAGIWSLGGLLAIFIPLITWSVTKGHYYDTFGRLYMQQQDEMQAQYEEYSQNQEQNEMDSYWDNMYQAANYYNNRGNGDREEDEHEGEGGGERLLEDQQYKSYYHSRYQNAQQQQQQQQQGGYYRSQQQQQQQQRNSKAMSPSWYNMLGGKQSTYYGSTTTSAATPFVYAWSLVLFVALIAYGAYAIYSKHSLAILAVALLVHLQFTLMLLLLLPQGVLPTPSADGSLSDPYGFYNSASMLMVYTFYSQIWFVAIAFVLGGIKISLEKTMVGTSPSLGESEAEDPVDIEDGSGKDYRKFDKLVIQ